MDEKTKTGWLLWVRRLFGADTGRVFWGKLGLAALVTAAFVFSLVVFIPYELYLGNAIEFSFSFSSFWWIPAVAGTAAWSVLLLVSLFLRGRVWRTFLGLVFGLTLASYVQGMFMNGMMKNMDGTATDWPAGTMALNLAVWCAVALLPAVLALFWKKMWRTVCMAGAAILTGAQVVALVSLLLTAGVPSEESHITYKGIYNVSAQNNVVVFVLDKFDQTYIAPMQEAYPDALEELHGFTYYPNTTGSYCYTHVAVPYLLTGQRIAEYDPTQKQYEEQINNSPYFDYITENTGSVGIYTDEYCLRGGEARARVENCEVTAYRVDFSTALNASVHASLYRALPFRFKTRFAYTAADFNAAVQTTDKEMALYNPDSHRVEAKLHADLQQQGLQIEESYGERSFRFIHLMGGHEPWHLDENAVFHTEETDMTAAAGVFRTISAYLRALQELELYENATVLITSDHGNASVLREGSGPQRNVNPVLFYKPAGVGWNEGLRTSEAPVSHDDLFATVIDALDGDGTSFGRRIDEIAEGETRERLYYWCAQDPTVEEDSLIHIEYAIRGDARDNESWHETGRLAYPNNSPHRKEADHGETD